MNSTAEKARPVYFFGCDMGGWQNKDESKGDALAICKWNEASPEHAEATADVLFFPVDEDKVLSQKVQEAVASQGKIIVAIDAALAWPVDFARLVAKSPEGVEYDRRRFDSAIANPYLYRQTERFIKAHVRKGKDPLTAPGDKFGNNSSKAQMLVAWFRTKLHDAYRPPFEGWDVGRARESQYTIIEVYPDASRQSKQFQKLKWPPYPEEMKVVGNKDIADAKICAMTGVCYAMEVGVMERRPEYPPIYLPDHLFIEDLRKDAIPKEGWIFAPYDQKAKKG
jgi:hypothetical protein